jgi:hypothetical protein
LLKVAHILRITVTPGAGLARNPSLWGEIGKMIVTQRREGAKSARKMHCQVDLFPFASFAPLRETCLLLVPDLRHLSADFRRLTQIKVKN